MFGAFVLVDLFLFHFILSYQLVITCRSSQLGYLQFPEQSPSRSRTETHVNLPLSPLSRDTCCSYQKPPLMQVTFCVIETLWFDLDVTQMAKNHMLYIMSGLLVKRGDKYFKIMYKAVYEGCCALLNIIMKKSDY